MYGKLLLFLRPSYNTNSRRKPTQFEKLVVFFLLSQRRRTVHKIAVGSIVYTAQLVSNNKYKILRFLTTFMSHDYYGT